jgi:hypothetical protein
MNAGSANVTAVERPSMNTVQTSCKGEAKEKLFQYHPPDEKRRKTK